MHRRSLLAAMGAALPAAVVASQAQAQQAAPGRAGRGAAAAAPAAPDNRPPAPKPPANQPEIPNIPEVKGGWVEKFWTGPDGTKFHYLEMGRGTPVILIHGSGGTAINWLANGLGASVARTNKVYALEMRGHGQTVGPDGKRQRRTPNMDLDVLDFMNAMNIRKAHIGGFSMGGGITGNLMARAPERFITAHFGGSGVTEVAEYRGMVPRDPEGTAPLDVEARRRYEARAAQQAALTGARGDPNAPENLSSQPVPIAVVRPPLDLSKCNFPILAVAGEFDTPYSKTHRLYREAKNFHRVILQNRGHLSSYMAGLAPEVYRKALTDFIVTNNPTA